MMKIGTALALRGLLLAPCLALGPARAEVVRIPNSNFPIASDDVWPSCAIARACVVPARTRRARRNSKLPLDLARLATLSAWAVVVRITSAPTFKAPDAPF